MSTYVGKLITSITSALDFNSATLSGAIDIIVIEDNAGNRQCSPFHVRFGKLQLLKTRGIPVDIHVNGHRTSLSMFLGAAGEAYFYHPQNECTTPTCTSEPCEDLHVSLAHQPCPPSPPPVLQPGPATDFPFGYISDSEVELTRHERAGTTEFVDEPRSPPLFPHRKWTPSIGPPPPPPLPEPHLEDQESALFGLPGSLPVPIPSLNISLEADSIIPADAVQAERNGMVPELAVGDGEAKKRNVEHPLTISSSIKDVVGEEETKLECRSMDGYDADEDAFQGLQEQVTSVLSRPRSLSFRKYHQAELDKEDLDGEKEKPWARPVKLHQCIEEEQIVVPESETVFDDDGAIAMSICSELLKPEMEEQQIMEIFERHQVTYDEFAKNPNLLHDPSLLFRVDHRLVEFRVAAPFIFSVLAFNERMDIDLLARLTTSKKKITAAPKSPPTPSRRFGWFGWSSPSIVGEPLLQDEDLNVLDTKIPVESLNERLEKEAAKSGEKKKGEMTEIYQDNINVTDKTDVHTLQNGNISGNEPKSDSTEYGFDMVRSSLEVGADISFEAMVGDESKNSPQRTICFADLDPESLSLRPRMEELMELDLKPGANTIQFVVESSGVELNCRIFLWGCDNKIVISDVDGTITRSDVLGHLLPAVGRDWSQVGVAGLYSEIEKNGYKMLYLTARPIGQASQTRAFLHSVTQGSAKLPNGPVLMSPNRLVESFTREVIRRKPHEFKIAALRDVRCLFAPDYNPFHAGFGNRDTDVISYRAVGLIPQRIFVVNPRGEVVVMKAKYESTASYSTLQDLVESVFPDIAGKAGLENIQALTEISAYNDWNYWEEALPDVDLDELLR